MNKKLSPTKQENLNYRNRLRRFGPAAGMWGRYPNVISEFIEIPGYDEPHTPPEFNNIYFMRYRYDMGTETPHPVRAVIIDQQGGGAGHSSGSEIGAQIVDAGKGEIEFWAVGRRQTGLEDTFGLKLATDARNPSIGRDYYFGNSAKFTPLQDGDIPFMNYWGLEVVIRDVECVLNLIPKNRQATNVFLTGHSLGGYLSLDFAGYQFPDGTAGFEKAAGIFLIDGGPGISKIDEATTAKWKENVQKLINGESAELTRDNSLLTPSPLVHVNNMLLAMSGYWDPDGESPHKFTPRAGYRPEGLAGGAQAQEFLDHLRITNEARICMLYDDDAIPGSMCQDSRNHFQSVRCGRLDFPPLSKPGVPPLSSIDPNKVYGWLSGGGGEPAGETDDGPLNCYPTNQLSWWMHNPPNPNPSRSDTACLIRFFSGERTNIKKPVKYKFPISGEIEIWRGNTAGWLWYGDKRDLLDTIQANNISAPEMNVTRKKDINIPLLAYSSNLSDVPGLLTIFPQASLEEYSAYTKITDMTFVNTKGVQYSASAKKLTTFPNGTNCRLYNHGCFATADNSLAGERLPGEVGANVITNTIVPWILAKAKGTTPVPTPASLGIK